MLLPKILKTKITRENFALVGVLIILAAIPLTVILLGVRQELRKRAAVEGSVLINAGAETTNSPNVSLTLAAPAGVTPPPTQTFSGDAADGNILGYGSYDEARNTSYNSDDTNETLKVGQTDVGATGRKKIDRSYVLFDTSSIPDNAAVTDVKLCLRISGAYPSSNPFDIRIHKFDFSTPIAGGREANYDGALAAPLDQNLTSVNIGGSIGPEVCNSVGLDPSWVSKTGYTKYALLVSTDVAGQNPGDNEYQIVTFYSANSQYSPRLEVTYTTPSAFSPSRFFSIPPAHASDSGCSDYCTSRGYDGGYCTLGCKTGEVTTNWSGCPSTTLPNGHVISGTCCCNKTKVPIPTPTSYSQGCTLSCSDSSGGYVTCSVSMSVSAVGCAISWDGKGGGYGGCRSFTRGFCAVDGSGGLSGAHTASVTATDGPEGSGNVVASCSDSFNVDCNFTPPPAPACEGLEGPDQAATGSFNFFEVGGSDIGPDGLYGWEASCGSFYDRISSTNTWTAPGTPGTCTITGQVKDGHGGVGECTKDVTVVKVPPSGVEAMMVSNSQNFQGVVEEPFASTKSWTLTEGDGLKTVWAKFKVGGVWTTPVSDSITLDTGAIPTPTPTLPPGVTSTPTPTLPPGATPTPTTPPGTPTPTPTPPVGGYLKLDLLKVWFWKQEGALGRGHEGSVILALKQGGNLVLEKEVKLDENGEANDVELPGVEAGTYDGFVYEPGYLTKKLANVSIGTSGNTLDFTKGETEYFLVGDFNGDQEVNILDFSIFVESYGEVGEE